MKQISYAQIAELAGLTERQVYNLAADGTLPGRDETTVKAFLLDRQQAALTRIGPGSNLLRFAEQTRRRAQELGGPRGHLPSDTDAYAAFGPAAVRAARIPDNGTCRWCWATAAASVHGGIQPGTDHRLYPAFEALLGPPCRDVSKRLMTAWKAHLDGQPLAPAEPPATKPAPARTAAAKPRTARYMGNKRCGTPVGQWCACHPSSNPKPVTAAAKPKTKPKPPRRSDVHGCGCQCEQHRRQS